MKTLRYMLVVMVMALLGLALTGAASADSGTEGTTGTEGIICCYPLKIADLTVVSAQWNGSFLSLRVKNQGTADAKPFSVSIWRDGGATTVYRFNSGLKAGHYSDWQHSFDQPLPAGADIHISVDCYWEVTEINENNNHYDIVR